MQVKTKDCNSNEFSVLLGYLFLNLTSEATVILKYVGALIVRGLDIILKCSNN